jgi:ABC-type bacteriocin/lantibiotic exporter with double-glycine peptidase domain
MYIILLALVILATPCQSEEGSKEVSHKMSQCGINALYSCMTYLGLDLSLDEVYSEISRTNDNQVNLSQLMEYARRHGIYVKAIRNPTPNSIKENLNTNSSVILQFKYPNGKQHMATLLRTRTPRNGILFFNVPFERFIISEQSLGELIEGSQGMLILSLTPFRDSFFSRINSSGYLWTSVSIIALCVFLATAISLRCDKKKKLHHAKPEFPTG